MTSPIDVTCDLIDATCHQIILVSKEQDESKEKILKLAKSLKFYQGQLESMCMEVQGSDGNDQDEGLLKTLPSKCRYLMAHLIVGVCTREAYTKQNGDLSGLIGGCDSLRDHLFKLDQFMPSTVTNSPDWKQSLGILDTQLSSLAILTSLRDQLVTLKTEVNVGIEMSNIRKHVKLLSEMKSQVDRLNTYVDPMFKATLDRMLFISTHVHSMKLKNTKKEMVKSLTFLINKIDVGIKNEGLPLSEIQTQLGLLVAAWGDLLPLPLPTMVEVGYFGYRS